MRSILIAFVLLVGCTSYSSDYRVNMKPIKLSEAHISVPGELEPLRAARDYTADRMVEDVFLTDGLITFDRLTSRTFTALSDDGFRDHLKDFRYDGVLVPHGSFVVRRDGNTRYAAFEMKRDGQPVDCTAFSRFVLPEDIGHKGHVYGFVCGQPATRILTLAAEVHAK